MNRYKPGLELTRPAILHSIISMLKQAVGGIALIVSVILSSISIAEDYRLSAGRLGVGLNFPGLGVRYFVLEKTPLELRMQIEPDVIVPSLRAFRYFNPVAKVYPYVGIEGAYARYKTEVTAAQGYAASGYLGGEYYIWKQVSLQFDFGLAYISLGENKHKLTVSGMEYVLNFGLTYYFGGEVRGESNARVATNGIKPAPARGASNAGK